MFLFYLLIIIVIYFNAKDFFCSEKRFNKIYDETSKDKSFNKRRSL